MCINFKRHESERRKEGLPLCSWQQGDRFKKPLSPKCSRHIWSVGRIQVAHMWLGRNEHEGEKTSSFLFHRLFKFTRQGGPKSDQAEYKFTTKERTLDRIEFSVCMFVHTCRIDKSFVYIRLAIDGKREDFFPSEPSELRTNLSLLFTAACLLSSSFFYAYTTT